LEDGDYNAFPSEVYIKGFLKNYSKFLGIDREKALALYRRENKFTKKENIENTSVEKKGRLEFSLTPERMVFAIVSLVVLAIIAYLGSQVNSVLRKPELNISFPTSVNAEETKEFETSDESIDIKGKISPGSTLTVNGDEVNTNNLEQFEISDIKLNSGNNEFVFVAESQFGRETKTTLIIRKTTVKEETANPEQQTPINEPVQEVKMDIEIKIHSGQANVHIVTDGKSQINQVLNVGETKTYTANTSVTVQTPRPTFVDVLINDKKYTLTSSKVYEWKIVDGQVKQTP